MALDLASVNSAHVVLDAEALVVGQGSPWHYARKPMDHQRAYLTSVVSAAIYNHALLVIEDMPAGMKRFDTITKNAARLQGMVEEKCRNGGQPFVYVMPSLWQRTLGVWKMTLPQQEKIAIEWGFTPPDVLAEWEAEGQIPPKGNPLRDAARTKAKKIRSDFVSAYLIGVWAQHEIEKQGSVGVAFTQPLTAIG